jgi:sarcosine oxidase subunit beta
MSTQKGATVIVVGGGVSGLSAAWWLARSGVDVLVLDKGIVGWEASGRNGGGASHFQSPLFAEEQRLWPMMDEMLGYSTEYQRGKLVLATTEGQLKHYRYMAETFCENGSPAHEIDLKEIRERVPMSGDNILGGVHLTIAGQANPQRTVQAYAWALQDLGGRILQHTPALRLVSEGGKVIGVETKDGI